MAGTKNLFADIGQLHPTIIKRKSRAVQVPTNRLNIHSYLIGRYNIIILLNSLNRELQACAHLDDLQWSQSNQTATKSSRNVDWHRQLNGKRIRLTSYEVTSLFTP